VENDESGGRGSQRSNSSLVPSSRGYPRIGYPGSVSLCPRKQPTVHIDWGFSLATSHFIDWELERKVSNLLEVVCSGGTHKQASLFNNTSILVEPSSTLVNPPQSVLPVLRHYDKSQTLLFHTIRQRAELQSGSLSLVFHRLLRELSFPECFLHFRVGSNLVVVRKNVWVLCPLRSATGDLSSLLAHSRDRNVSERHRVGDQVARGARSKMLVEELERTSLPPEAVVMYLVSGCLSECGSGRRHAPPCCKDRGPRRRAP